jgi:hypothetical protein
MAGRLDWGGFSGGFETLGGGATHANFHNGNGLRFDITPIDGLLIGVGIYFS